MQRRIELADDQEAMELLGVQDRNVKRLRELFDVKVTARGRTVILEGEETVLEEAGELFQQMRNAVGKGKPAEELLDQFAAAQRQEAGDEDTWGPSQLERIARTPGQLDYLRAIARSSIVMSVGPAGTGKTYLAVRMAVEALKVGMVKKIVLCRPAVEAGEKLGFLPGDFQAKVNPYLRPLYDALNDLLDYDQVRRYSDREIIEIVPLAYMRGRTLNRAFIILDEAQNTTRAQMKMFLTRMGTESRIVVNGDVTQVDLPQGQPSGLLHARRILHGIEGLEWVELQTRDIVRNPLVAKIVKAYERSEGAPAGRDRKLK